MGHIELTNSFTSAHELLIQAGHVFQLFLLLLMFPCTTCQGSSASNIIHVYVY